MDVPETSMKVSKGEPESPLQEASIGVPQTPSNYDIVIQVETQGHAGGEGENADVDTMRGYTDSYNKGHYIETAACAASACSGIAAARAHEFRHRCMFCRRTSYAKASVSSAARSTVQRFQEWTLPYLADTKSTNDLFMRVLAAVGPTVEEFASIARRAFSGVGREWLEDEAFLSGRKCICNGSTDGKPKHHKTSQPQSTARLLRLEMQSHMCIANGCASATTNQSGTTVALPPMTADKNTRAGRVRSRTTTRQNTASGQRGEDSSSNDFDIDPKHAVYSWR